MKGWILLGGLLVALVAILGLTVERNWAEEEKELKADLRKMQGKWEYTFKDEQGEVQIRKVKEIKDETETVTWYLPDGKVYQVNRVDIKLEMKGKDRLLIYSNWKYLEGPEKGKEIQGKLGSYVYKIEGDAFTEVLETGEGEIQWKRMKEKKRD